MSDSFDRSENIKQIKEAFPHLINNDKTRAFSQLAQMRGTEGASAIMDLLNKVMGCGAICMRYCNSVENYQYFQSGGSQLPRQHVVNYLQTYFQDELY